MDSMWRPILRGALLGALTAPAVIALSWLGSRAAGLPFVPFDLFDAVGRWLPGPVVTFGIDRIVDVVTALGARSTDAAAKLAEQLMALAGTWLAGIVLGAAVGSAPRDRAAWVGALGGGVLAAVAMVAAHAVGWPPAGPLPSALWLIVLLVGWGAALGALAEGSRAPLSEADGAGRRGFLGLVAGGALAVVTVAVGLGTWLGRTPRSESEREERRDPSLTDGPAAAPPEAELAARIEPTAGTRPEVTPNADFYRIDINTLSPAVDGDAWRLVVGGLVARPLELSLAALRAMPSQSQIVTMGCISNRIGGDLISTTRFTGVPLADVMAEAGIEAGATHVFVESADGFYETIEPADLRDPRTLLAYAMNGVPLPREHGFPLRVYIPDRYGMKQPKWIERLTAVDTARPGYWVERGWSREARPHVVSMIDDVATDMMIGGEAAVPVGGIAWAGARGIQRVEVQVDDGPWQAAELRVPPLGPLAWVQWRFAWPYAPGEHTFRVRATDGNGTPQVLEPSGARPDGATGVHAMTTTL